MKFKNAAAIKARLVERLSNGEYDDEFETDNHFHLAKSDLAMIDLLCELVPLSAENWANKPAATYISVDGKTDEEKRLHKQIASLEKELKETIVAKMSWIEQCGKFQRDFAIAHDQLLTARQERDGYLEKYLAIVDSMKEIVDAQ